MKKLKYCAIIILLMLCVKCGKDEPAQPEETETPEQKEQMLIDSKVILTINDKQFTNKDFKEYVKGRHADLKFVESNLRVASRVFDTFVEHRTVMYVVDRENIPVVKKEIDSYLRDRHLPLDMVDDQTVIDTVKAQKYLDLKLYKDIDVTDAEIREYYNRNLDQYRRSSEVLLHEIVVKERDNAYEILKALNKKPEDFAEIAKKESISRDAKNGGQMGYYEKGTLPKDMEEVVFALELNTISPVVNSPYGYHIFKVTKKKKERLLFLEKVTDDIKSKLLSDKLRWAYEDFFSQLKRQLKITIKYPALYFTYQSIEEGEQND